MRVEKLQLSRDLFEEGQIIRWVHLQRWYNLWCTTTIPAEMPASPIFPSKIYYICISTYINSFLIISNTWCHIKLQFICFWNTLKIQLGQLTLLYLLMTLIHALKDSFLYFFASIFWSSFVNILKDSYSS